MLASDECVDDPLMAGAAGRRKIIRIQAAWRKSRSEHTSMGRLQVFGRRIPSVAFLAPDALLLVHRVKPFIKVGAYAHRLEQAGMANYAIVVSICCQSGFIGLLLRRHDGKSYARNTEQDQQTNFGSSHSRSFSTNQSGESITRPFPVSPLTSMILIFGSEARTSTRSLSPCGRSSICSLRLVTS